MAWAAAAASPSIQYNHLIVSVITCRALCFLSFWAGKDPLCCTQSGVGGRTAQCSACCPVLSVPLWLHSSFSALFYFGEGREQVWQAETEIAVTCCTGASPEPLLSLVFTVSAPGTPTEHPEQSLVFVLQNKASVSGCVTERICAPVCSSGSMEYGFMKITKGDFGIRSRRNPPTMLLSLECWEVLEHRTSYDK